MTIQTLSVTAKGAHKQDDFEAWLADRHKWLQTAAHRLVESKALPSEQEIAELSSLCLEEASGVGGQNFSSVAPGAIVQAGKRPRLHLRGLSEVRGVNKIKDRASLSFGTGNLAVVYGANGSGKTGFARVIKQACGNRAREDIHPNVFEKVSADLEATISVSADAVPHNLKWTQESGPIQLLRHVHVFDSKTAANYVSAENEVHYAPSQMRFVSSLIRTCDKVAAHLGQQKLGYVRKLPQIPTEFATTKAARWLVSLNASTTQASIDENTNYTQEMDEERLAAEGALAQKDIAGRLATLVRERANVLQVIANLNLLREKLSDHELSVLLQSRAGAVAKRKVAIEAAESVFANAPLEGVGQDIWMALWEQAKKFSEAYAYPGKPFPNLDAGSRCVFCQQELETDGKHRLGHFEAFVCSGLEEAARLAERHYADLLKKLPAVPSAKDWALQASAVKIAESDANALLAAIVQRSEVATSALTLNQLADVNWEAADLAQSSILEALNAEEKTLKELQQDGKRKQIESRVLDLRAIQWLGQVKALVVGEVQRVRALATIDKAIGLSHTAVLTRKNNELASEELDKGYQRRFAEELQALGGKRLPVIPSANQVGKGKVTFGLKLVGVARTLPAEKVLSEGEARIVALAAFLADIAGSGNPTPFIFDDPISSLDQDFEEKVVKRLMELSKTRQVIVFTHRLSFLALIESLVERHKKEAVLAQKPSLIDLHIESVCSFGHQAGVVQAMSIRELKPRPAINRLKSEQIPQLRKLHDAGDVAGYDERANGLCSDLRILVERCVESVLLNEVLVRFRRAVQTQNKIGTLAKITSSDCAFLDDLMTRYSVFEHSQSDELPAVRPDIDEIESDVVKLATWIDEFGKRPVA